MTSLLQTITGKLAILLAWLSSNSVGLLGIIIGGFIAYHVYFLSKRLGIKDHLIHKAEIKKQVNDLLGDRGAGVGRKVELINVKKYFTHYPETNEADRNGYTYLGAELKSTRFDGVEFFCAMPVGVYQHNDGKLYLKQEFEGQDHIQIAYPVGLVPYEWIDYVESKGDENVNRPKFFTKFNGPKKSPYKYKAYFVESDTYQESIDPPAWKYKVLNVVA